MDRYQLESRCRENLRLHRSRNRRHAHYPPDPGRPAREEEQILAKLRRGEKVERFETIRQTKDRRLIDVSITTSAIKDAGGKIIGISKIARDITERKKAFMDCKPGSRQSLNPRTTQS